MSGRTTAGALLDLVTRPRDRGAGALPAGCRRVETRALPYPFAGFFTIASDCDSMDLESALRVGATIRERFALPIADSFFPEWLYDRALHDEGEVDRRRFLQRNGRWLRAYHQGWFDTVHGWFNRLSVRIADDLLLARPAAGASGPRRRTGFVAPPGWQQKEPPRYLLFDVALDKPSAELQISGWHGAEHLFETRLTLRPGRHCLDLWQHLAQDDERLSALEIEFDLLTEDATLRLQRPLLISDRREDIDAQRRLLDSFHIGARVFTSHGIGLVIGPAAMPDEAANDPRWRADHPANAHYCLDLLRSFGIEFFTSFHNTCTLDSSQPGDLLQERSLADGSRIYDLRRYAYVPRAADGTSDHSVFTVQGEPSSHSLADFFDLEIEGALGEIAARPDHGALLYTHLLCSHELNRRYAAGERPDRREIVTLDAAGEAALARLADRYYDLGGTVAAEHRIFVAPTAVLLRLGQIGREIADHAWYDPRRNAVHVGRWYDPVQGRLVPEPRELRHLTFYVERAHDACVFLDGEALPALIRNPRDASGRESVAVADVSCPRALLGRVPLSANDQITALCGLVLTEPNAARCNGHRLTLEASEGCLEIAPAPVEIANFDALALSFRKSAPELRVRCDLALAGGLCLSFCEDGFTDSERALTIEPWTGEGGRVVVLPFHRLLEALPRGERQPPSGQAAAFRLRLQGAPGTGVSLDYVHVLRDDERPLRDDCLLGGDLGGRSDIDAVVMTRGSEKRRAEITDEGLYFFASPVGKGEIIRIEGLTRDGTTVAPAGGAVIEVLTDSCDIDFAPAS